MNHKKTDRDIILVGLGCLVLVAVLIALGWLS